MCCPRGGIFVRVAETVAALCVALLGVTVIALARQLPYEADYGPGAGFLPLWLGVALVILSVFLLREARAPAADGATITGESAGFLQFAPGALQPWLVFFVSTVVVSLLFERLGFALAIGLFMFVTMRWVANLSWLATILFIVLTPVGLYFLFVRFLMVPIPMGPSWV
jgi:putative tricarboxylic transport membrane protein